MARAAAGAEPGERGPAGRRACQVSAPLVLVSHALCPYVQRAAIVLAEKGVPFERRDIDLANKPSWFLKVSPLG
ncbi:glutathione S-transferase N-terminal domain-containing protein, partial [Escherichia coli]|nr:glutathione S-transferase N-terminal domain-containing protein [Escherichia coli]